MFIIRFTCALCFGIPLTQSTSAYISSLDSYSTPPQQEIDCKENVYKSVPIIPPVYAIRSYFTRDRKKTGQNHYRIQLVHHTIENHLVEEIMEREAFYRLQNFLHLPSSRVGETHTQAAFTKNFFSLLKHDKTDKIFLLWIFSRKLISK